MTFIISHEPPMPMRKAPMKGTFGFGSSDKNQNGGTAHTIAKANRSHVSRVVTGTDIRDRRGSNTRPDMRAHKTPRSAYSHNFASRHQGPLRQVPRDLGHTGQSTPQGQWQ